MMLREIIQDLDKVKTLQDHIIYTITEKDTGNVLEYFVVAVFSDINRMYIYRYIEIDGDLKREVIAKPPIPKSMMEMHEQALNVAKGVANVFVDHINEIINKE